RDLGVELGQLGLVLRGGGRQQLLVLLVLVQGLPQLLLDRERRRDVGAELLTDLGDQLLLLLWAGARAQHVRRRVRAAWGAGRAGGSGCRGRCGRRRGWGWGRRRRRGGSVRGRWRGHGRRRRRRRGIRLGGQRGHARDH